MKKMCVFGAVSFFILLFLISCQGANGGGTNPPKPDNPEKPSKLLLKFASDVTCVDKDNKTIATDKEVKVGEEYTFTANTDEGKLVEYWIVNGVNKENEVSKRFTYKVNINDANQEGIIKISFKIKVLTSCKIKFEANIKCVDKDNVALTTGTKAYEGTVLTFTATPTQGKLIKAWTVKGIEKTNETGTTFKYTVKVNDAKDEGTDKVITIGFTEKDPAVNLNFPSNCICRNTEGTPLTSPQVVNIGERYEFEARVTDGKKLEAWYVNNKKKTAETSKTFSYTVDNDDVVVENDKRNIHIRFEEVSAKKVKIRFENNINCKNRDTLATVKSGDAIDEGSKLEFTATIATDREIEGWYKNNVKIDGQTQTILELTVRYEEGVDEGTDKVITIEARDKAKEVPSGDELIIKFDNTTIGCADASNFTPINSGATVKDGDELEFNSMSFTEVFWYVKGIKKTNKKQEGFIYTVSAQDAVLDPTTNKKTITVTYQDN